MNLVEIQRINAEKGTWETLPLHQIRHSDGVVVVIGGRFRILVDGEVIYDSREARENGLEVSDR